MKNNEIELIDLLVVLWEKKIFILSGVLISFVIAVMVSFSLPQIYQLEMKVRPGLVNESQNLKKIKGNINAKIYTERIIKNLFDLGVTKLPVEIEFKVDIPKNSDVIDIYFETSDIALGKKILESLYSFLLLDEKVKIELVKDKNGYDIRLKKIKLELINAQKKSNLQREDVLEKRIASLIEILNDEKAENIFLKDKQKRILKSNRGNSEQQLSVLLYTNIIQQKMLSNSKIIDVINKNFDLVQGIRNETDFLDADAKKIAEEILQKEKIKINHMVVVQPPISSKNPINPRKIVIIVSTGLIALFCFILAAFFIEYWNNYKKE